MTSITKKDLTDIAQYIGFLSVPKSFLDCYQNININDYNFLFEPKHINNALDFYNIKNQALINHITNTITKANNEPLLKKYIIITYYILFVTDNDIALDIWSWQHTKAIQNKHKEFYFNAFVLLSGFAKHQKTMASLSYNNAQIKNQKQTIKNAITRDKRTLNIKGIRFSQMLWGSYFVNGKIIKVSRLEFEKASFNNTVSINGKTYKKGEPCIKIHIPREGKSFDIIAVKSSIAKAKAEVEKYFGQTNATYTCHSWLLSKDIKQALKKDSNIMAFQKLFYIKKDSDCTQGLLKFLFLEKYEHTNFNKLKENTSLRKSVKQILIAKQKIYSGLGVLKD